MPTVVGNLDLTAQSLGDNLTITLGDHLHAETELIVWWPSRVCPASVVIDGVEHTEYDHNFIKVNAPFKTLVATWDSTAGTQTN